MTIFRQKGARTKRLLGYLRRRAKGKPEKRPAMDCESFPTLFRKRAVVFTDTADFTMRAAQDGISATTTSTSPAAGSSSSRAPCSG